MKRFALSSFTFALLSISYALYARVVVPRIEPPLPPLHARHHPPDTRGGNHEVPESSGPKEAREIARRAFGPEAPEVKAPFVWQFYSEQTTVYFFTEDYSEAANNQVVLEPLSMVVHQTSAGADGLAEGQDSETAGLTTLHCPRARIEFDKLDMKRLEAGKPVGGLLEGAIVIRHHRPGDDEPSVLKTRDVRFVDVVEAAADVPPRLATDAPVEFSHGKDYGTGQGLDIFLTAPPQDRKTGGGLAVSGIGSLRIRRNVRFVIHVDREAASFSRLAGRPEGAAPGPSDGDPVPLEIRCGGPFQYSLETDTASFRNAVEVLHPISPTQAERLQCEQLDLLFARNDVAAVQRSVDAPAGLAFRRLRATGKPVLIDSPPNNVHVLATFLAYDAEQAQTVLANDEGPVLIVDAAGETRAGRITIKQDDQGEVASVLAEGPGRLWRRDEKSQQDLRAVWNKQLSIDRDKELYVLRLRGRAGLHATAQGKLEAEQIDAWLRPTQSATVSPGLEAGADDKPADNVAGMEPVKLEAEGDVHIDSPQLSGNLSRLDLWFDEPDRTKGGAGTARPGAAAASSKTSGLARQGSTADTGKLHVDARLLRVQFLRTGRETQVSQVWAEGKIEARQEQATGNGPGGLALRGEFLHLRRTGSNETLRLTGSPAEVSTEEMLLKGQILYLDRAVNRLDVDGAGVLVLAVDRDFEGRQLDTPKQLEIRWSGDLSFDGSIAVFRKAVQARLDVTRILCDRMDVILEKAIRFTEPPDDVRGTAKIRRIVCQGDPAHHRTVELLKEVHRDGKLVEYQHGVSLHMIFEPSTGDFEADGPGEFVSVALGDDPGVGLGFEGPRAAAQRPATAEPGLKRLQIRYYENMTGNLNQRRAVFHDRVDVLYGPVQRVDQVLDRHELPDDGLWLLSDTLEVAQEEPPPDRSPPPGQSPARAQAPVLITATGNVKADVYKNGLYSALAHRISYSEAWDRLIVEGRGPTQAMLSRQLQPGAEREYWNGDRITFHPRSEKLKVDGATAIEGRR